MGKRTLFIDMAYSLAELRQRGHLEFFEARHSRDYFERVVALHPLADRVAEVEAPIVRRRFSDRQEVIEARSAAMGLPRWLFPLDLLLTQRRLWRQMAALVEREEIDVIQATDPLYGGLLGVWLRRATGRPLVVHVLAHYENLYAATGAVAMPRLFPFHWLENRVIRYVFERADLVAAGTATLGDYAETMGARRERIRVFPVSKYMMPEHRRPPEGREPADPLMRELGIPTDVPLFLTIARLEPVKMVDHAIRAMGMIVEAHPNAILLLAGKGSEQAALERLVSELGLTDNVRFLGLVSQDRLARLIPHVVALSPMTGMALFETSMGGAPAIAYDVDSQVAELVVSGETGWLVPFGDHEAMGKAGIHMLDHPDETRRMGSTMRRHAARLADPATVYANEHAGFDTLARNVR
jgi:glycosyltransferase involved in cell wall biosynthesis